MENKLGDFFDKLEPKVLVKNKSVRDKFVENQAINNHKTVIVDWSEEKQKMVFLPKKLAPAINKNTIDFHYKKEIKGTLYEFNLAREKRKKELAELNKRKKIALLRSKKRKNKKQK